MGTQENSSKGQIKYNTEVPKLPCISMCKEAFVKGQVQKICFMFEKTWGARIMKWWDLWSLSILLLSLIEKEHEINGNTFLSSIEGIGFPLYNTEKCSIRTSVLLCIYNRVPVRISIISIIPIKEFILSGIKYSKYSYHKSTRVFSSFGSQQNW